MHFVHALTAHTSLQLTSLLAGSLPPSWGGPRAFPQLATLTLFDLALTGTLPVTWAKIGSFPGLQDVGLGADKLSLNGSCMAGPLPAEWGSAVAFQEVQILSLGLCVQGEEV